MEASTFNASFVSRVVVSRFRTKLWHSIDSGGVNITVSTKGLTGPMCVGRAPIMTSVSVLHKLGHGYCLKRKSHPRGGRDG